MSKKMREARKAGRQAKRAARRSARQEKQSARKDARAERKDARQTARAGRKDARQVARAGRKDARQDARATRKTARQEARQIKKAARSDPSTSRKDARQQARGLKKEGRQEARSTKKAARQFGRSTKQTARQEGRATRQTARQSGRATKKDARQAARTMRKAGRTTAKTIRGETRTQIEQAKSVFNLAVRFSFAVANRFSLPAADKAAIETTVLGWIAEAERLYDMTPKLEITPSWNWEVPAQVDSDLVFESGREASKFMDDNFDNLVGARKTQGSMQVLIADSAEVKSRDLGGRAFFPHCVSPFSRKYGIIMTMDADVTTFAHELGHSFSLKHTFEPYVGFKKNCNKGYPKGESGKGKTLDTTTNTINVMDYDRDGSTVVLNRCQEERAAAQRKRYMTADGEVNYRRLKGLR